MATFGKYRTIPGVVASSDLSSKQYYAVKFSSTAGEVKLADSADAYVCGLLQNEPEAGEAAEVAFSGIAKGICESTAVTYGGAVTSNSTGELQLTKTDNDQVIGRALAAGAAAGDIIPVLVNLGWRGTAA